MAEAFQCVFFGFVFERFFGWKAKKSAQNTRGWPLFEVAFTARSNDEGDAGFDVDRRAPLWVGILRCVATEMGLAGVLDGAKPALWVFGCAERGTQFHHGLVPSARVLLDEALVSPILQPLAVGICLRKDTRQNPPNVAVDGRSGRVECNGTHGCSRIRPDSRECQPAFKGFGKSTDLDALCSFVQVSCPGVVATSFPRFENFVHRGLGQMVDGREFF